VVPANDTGCVGDRYTPRSVESSVEPLEGNKVRVSVSVGADEFEPAINEAFAKIAREVRIPGFRPGKAPRRVLEAHFGKGVARGQALQDALPEFYVAAVREHDVDVIAPPEIDITDGEEDGPVNFEAVVEVRPVVSVGGYANLRVVVPSPTPTDADIDDQVERLRNAHATFSAVDRPGEDGDVMVIDIVGELDGEPAPGLTAKEYSYELGSGGIVAEVDEQLRGASAGDHLEFSAAHPVREDATLDFDVTVIEVRERVLPDADDDFATVVSEFETMEELRADLTERATRIRRGQADAAMRERVGESLAALVTDDLPEALVDSEMRQRLGDLQMRLSATGNDLGSWLASQGRDPEEFIGELRRSAEGAARLDLALRSVAAAEAIGVDDEDLDSEWLSVAERVGVSAEEVEQRFVDSGQLGEVRTDIAKRKAFDWVLERVELVDEDGGPVDRASLAMEEPGTVESVATGDSTPDGSPEEQKEDEQ
jgi:trigger factor